MDDVPLGRARHGVPVVDRAVVRLGQGEVVELAAQRAPVRIDLRQLARRIDVDKHQVALFSRRDAQGNFLADLQLRAGDLHGAARILRAADEERAARKLRVRPDDECALDALRTALGGPPSRPGRAEPIDDLVAELLAEPI